MNFNLDKASELANDYRTRENLCAPQASAHGTVLYSEYHRREVSAFDSDVVMKIAPVVDVRRRRLLIDTRR